MKPWPLVVLLLPALGVLTGGVARADELEAIEALLESPRYEKRLEGLQELAKVEPSDDAEDLGIRALEDEDWAVQIAATQALAAVGEERARKALVRLTYEGEIVAVRDAAIKALEGNNQPRTVKRLTKLAPKADDREQVYMIEAAGRLAGPDDAKRLQRFIKERSEIGAAAGVRAYGRLLQYPDLRKVILKNLEKVLKLRDETGDFLAYVAAVEACASIDDPVARDLLVDELLLQEDDDLFIQERIARGLEAMTGVDDALRAAIPRAKKDEPMRRLARLIGRMRRAPLRPELEALLSHDYERVRSEAARGLGRIAEPASKDRLLAALESEAEPVVRVELVTALSKVLEPEAFRALAPRIQEDESGRSRMQYVVDLSDMGDPEGIATLALFIEDDDWEVGCAATVSIGTLGIAENMEIVTPLLESRDWRLRAAAYEALGRLRARQAVPLLIEGLRDKDPVVKGVCHGNLQFLCNRSYGPRPKDWLVWWERHGTEQKIVKRSRRTKEEIEREAEDRYGESTGRLDEKDEERRKREIEIMQKARIFVVRGAWDHVEIVLRHLDIKHTAMRAQELKDSGLNPNQIVLVNCEGTMDRTTRERVRWFVVVGGYLMSTDWALTKAVGQTFPGYLDQSAKSNTGNDVVVVEDASPGHPLSAGVFDGVPALKWWLEIQAFPIEVVYPERCQVLVDSRYMRQRYGTSPMAAVFRHGLGRVQHSVSHFYLQEEAMQDLREKRDRMIFAVDHLGLPLDRVRRLAGYGRFDGAITEKTMEEIAPDYSMFRMIVNMVKEKADWVEGL